MPPLVTTNNVLSETTCSAGTTVTISERGSQSAQQFSRTVSCHEGGGMLIRMQRLRLEKQWEQLQWDSQKREEMTRFERRKHL